MRPSSLEAAHQETTEPKKTVMQELFGEEKAAFSQHYILYSVSVIVRTGVEVVFIYLQVAKLLIVTRCLLFCYLFCNKFAF